MLPYHIAPPHCHLGTSLVRHRFRVSGSRELAALLRSCGMRAWQIQGRPGNWTALVHTGSCGRSRPASTLPAPCVSAPSGYHPASDASAVACPASPHPPHQACTETDTRKNRTWYHHVYNMIKNTIMAAGLAGALASTPVKGATMVVSEPTNNGFSYALDALLTNNNTGAIYNTATTSIYSTLANQIFALGNSGAASVADMINGINGGLASIRGPPAGEVDNGWSVLGNNSGVLTFTNNGLVDFGVPLYDTWQSTSSNAAQDTMAIRLGIPNTLLEQNGTLGYQPFTLANVASGVWNPANYDPIIVLMGTPEANAFYNASNFNGTVPDSVINNAFVGTDQGGFNSFPTNGQQYALINPNSFGAIPEPSTTGLLGLGLAGLLLRRNRPKADTKYE